MPVFTLMVSCMVLLENDLIKRHVALYQKRAVNNKHYQ